MSEPLTNLRNTMLGCPKKETTPKHHYVSIYNSCKPQTIHHVPFNQPTLLLVASGRKEVRINDVDISIKQGELLILPPNTTIFVGSFPNKRSEYLGLAVRFDERALKHFRLIYGSHLDQWNISAQWHKKSPNTILSLLTQMIVWEKDYSADIQLILHRQVELLLILAQEGLVGNVLLNEHPSWKLRVSQLLLMDPARSWRLKDVCLHLGVSESSLRRKLLKEESSFRELLEETRLSVGLSLLLETTQTIGQVADAVGYQSQSRFGERFKTRFGLTPSDLRRTLD